MLMTTPYFEATVRETVRTSSLPVGIHLALTLERNSRLRTITASGRRMRIRTSTCT